MKYNLPKYTPYNVTIDDQIATYYNITYDEFNHLSNESDYFIVVKKSQAYSINDGIYIDFAEHNLITRPKHIQ